MFLRPEANFSQRTRIFFGVWPYVLNAHARDTTAASGLVNLLVRPMVGASPKAIIWVAVQGSIRYLEKAANRNSLWVILCLPVTSILGSTPTLRLPRGLQYPSNQVNVCYCRKPSGRYAHIEAHSEEGYLFSHFFCSFSPPFSPPPHSNPAVFWSSDLSDLLVLRSSGPLVRGSSSPLVLWSRGSVVTVVSSTIPCKLLNSLDTDTLGRRTSV